MVNAKAKYSSHHQSLLFCFQYVENTHRPQSTNIYQIMYLLQWKIIWSPADIVCLPTDKEIISLSF